MPPPTSSAAFGVDWNSGNLVQEIIPEFQGRWKDEVTFAHLLTHTSGLPVDHDETEYVTGSWGEALGRALGAELQTRPGTAAQYSLSMAWKLLAEAVYRISGKRLGDVLQESVFEPLDLKDCYLGVPNGLFDAYAAKLRGFFYTEFPTVSPVAFLVTREVLTKEQPGMGAVGPAAGLGRVLESLLGAGGRTQLMTPTMRAAMLSKRRRGLSGPRIWRGGL